MKLFLLTLVLTFSTFTAKANLVQNGSFEQNLLASNTWSVFTGTSVNKWNILAGAGIEIRHHLDGEASDGFNFVELDSDNNSTISQHIITTSGVLYELLFDYSPRINQGPETNAISVFWNSTLLAEMTGTGGVSNLWVTQHFFVTGTGSDHLRFSAAGINDGLGGNIDYIQLNEVPLPAAAWLIGSALILFGFARRSSI